MQAKWNQTRKEEKESMSDQESLENCSNPFFVPDRLESCDLQGQVIRSEGKENQKKRFFRNKLQGPSWQSR